MSSKDLKFYAHTQGFGLEIRDFYRTAALIKTFLLYALKKHRIIARPVISALLGARNQEASS